mgnify:CR=1 FL=1
MVTAVVQILDDILPEGTVVYTEDKNGNRQDYTSSGDTYLDYPLAVLINGESASASEILAGAVKDYQYGTLIGTTTFGKGIVQTIFPLEDGDAVKLTTAKYFTPNGNYIHGVGIGPDIELEYRSYRDYELPQALHDNRIDLAITLGPEIQPDLIIRTVPLTKIQDFLFCAKDHPLAKTATSYLDFKDENVFLQLPPSGDINQPLQRLKNYDFPVQNLRCMDTLSSTLTAIENAGRCFIRSRQQYFHFQLCDISKQCPCGSGSRLQCEESAS